MDKMNKVFRIVSLPIIFGAMMVLLTACPQHKEPMYKDLGKIPAQYLATVPYQDGDVFRMQHESDRVVIDFTVSRHRQKETGFDYIYLEKYKPAPNYYYDYEVDITKCTPNYPIFDVEINFSNLYMLYEEEGMASEAEKQANLFVVGSARIPFYGEDHSNYNVADSLEINGHYYHDVFKLTADYYNVEEGSIYAETYYYNYETGLLGVIMSNGEKYWYYEE
jgi:hypothetical protein